ncbi:MAG: hypothetical protein ACFFCS_21900 [Candidatus Hodarchaeota archaeon]
MSRIYQLINRGEYELFGISSWNNLLYRVFGEIHFERGKYDGEEGLELAKSELREYKKQYRKIPTMKSGEWGGILSALKIGKWKDLKIKTWNDLLMATFGRINKSRHIELLLCQSSRHIELLL